ncbi:hypothetical protein GUITHDRAFT_77411 [Guillardia theta CCMP2712]|uniref:DUS-like FMN-binding domain-containing protein n=1 Tax=Guillardia theta (strain CCMP2712) TaxID=905079 RepID=L1IPD3_GUITC|nr:hypothetical protein GUITHDRAFT_77411 [Guillardia theta CCMP2712]EKX38123.1 hypothetical protein GUITHDRAFT_77411 [Guillardia theta CCMP2712]|eukprot:XP_005825103.1 hypothetical protein GUITHDRAFT_77411 [Guillardia theta CCMP2712]
MQPSTSLDFQNAVVLAPMVRASTLPLRMLALDYGADFVWTEEIVARKIALCSRFLNERLGTVEFYSPDAPHFRVFQTCEAEREKVIFQIGTNSAREALEAAMVVVNDVAAIDLNMGCPKHFSVTGGMGAALLSKPETAADIIKTLKRNINLPVTAKIRLLKTRSETAELMKRLESAGVDAITVHCRYVATRPHERALWEELEHCVSAVSVPVIGNGDVLTRSDGLKLMEKSRCAGVMIARGVRNS